jgi:hypothetical protein
MAVSKEQYEPRLVAAATSVLLEIGHLLQPYKDGFVVVGGSVPGLLFDDVSEMHIGSMDVDIALDQNKIPNTDYHTIRQLLLDRGYSPEEQPFSFTRSVIVNGDSIKVRVDFLAGEYGGTGKSRRTQRVQDLRPRKARACDLAFDQPIVKEIRGTLPEGGKDQVVLQVASIVPFLMMKAQALQGRMKEKDAYDIYYCLRNHPGGHAALVKAFRSFPKSGLIDEGLKILREKFGSPDHLGPVFVARFLGEADSAAQEMICRDAFERVHALVEALE